MLKVIKLREIVLQAFLNFEDISKNILFFYSLNICFIFAKFF